MVERVSPPGLLLQRNGPGFSLNERAVRMAMTQRSLVPRTVVCTVNDHQNLCQKLPLREKCFSVAWRRASFPSSLGLHPSFTHKMKGKLKLFFLWFFFFSHCASFTNLSGLVLEADDDFLFTEIFEHFRDKNWNWTVSRSQAFPVTCHYPGWEINNRMYPYHVSHSETEFRIGVFLGKIICRKLEFPQI